MNPWDLATWIAAVALAGSAAVIFVLFLRDARGILERNPSGSSDESESDDTTN